MRRRARAIARLSWKALILATTKPHLSIPQSHHGHIMVTFFHIQATSWPYPGHILSTSWPLLGHILATNWSRLNYNLTWTLLVTSILTIDLIYWQNGLVVFLWNCQYSFSYSKRSIWYEIRNTNKRFIKLCCFLQYIIDLYTLFDLWPTYFEKHNR